MTRKEAIDKFLLSAVPNIADIIKFKRSKGSKLSLEELKTTLAKPAYNLGRDMEASASAVLRFTRELFPDKGNEKLCTYLFNKFEHKYCSKCAQVLPLEVFSKDYCRSCYSLYYKEYMPKYYSKNKGRYALYRAEYDKALKQATPSYANLKKIREIYDDCPPGYQVDHIIPIRGNTVCGLHVETNLQYLTPYENNSKNNKY